MRGLLKAYAIASSSAVAVLIAGGVLAGAASWLAPGLASAAWKRASDGLARLAGEAAETRPGGGLAAAAPSASQGPVLLPPPPAPFERSRGDDGVDVSALEARLRLLEGDLAREAPRGGLASATGAGGDAVAGIAARLEAWESLRKPLVAFLNAAGGAGEERAPLRPDAPIEALARDARAMLEALGADYGASRERLLRTIEPATVARMLSDESVVSEDRGLRLLSLLPGAGATEVIEKLSRRAPARAARLLERLTASPAGAGTPAATKTPKKEEDDG